MGRLTVQIFVGSSESEAKKFAAATFDVKRPVEEAEEDFAKPASWTDDADSNIPAFQRDPIGYVRGKFQQFVNVAVHDPVGAFKKHPETGAGVGVVAATLLGMIGLCASTSVQCSGLTPQSSLRSFRPPSRRRPRPRSRRRARSRRRRRMRRRPTRPSSPPTRLSPTHL